MPNGTKLTRSTGKHYRILELEQEGNKLQKKYNDLESFIRTKQNIKSLHNSIGAKFPNINKKELKDAKKELEKTKEKLNTVMNKLLKSQK